jgi:hypothetical protein
LAGVVSLCQQQRKNHHAPRHHRNAAPGVLAEQVGAPGAAGISEGPLFRPVLKGGRIQPEALTAFSAAQMHYAERTGLDPAVFAGHSLRSGFLTSAAEAGASVFKMMEVSRHKSVDVLRGYVSHACTASTGRSR